MEPTPLQLPDQILMDDPDFVTHFGKNSNNLKQATDNKQRPDDMKRESFMSYKKIPYSGKVEMGYDFRNNVQCKDFVDYLGMEFNVCDLEVISSMPKINADNPIINDLPEMSYSTKSEELIRIQALPSDKKRNSPYFVKGKAITTKNMTPVTFIMSGVKAKQKVSVSMRYTDEFHNKKAVKPCKLHQDWKERSDVLPTDFNFYLTGACRYETTASSHPTAVLYIPEDFKEGKEVFKFFVVFLCLNSCHRLNGKMMKLVISVYDYTSTSLIVEEDFTIRVCKNVKRDHKEKSRSILKRKNLITEEDHEEDPLKIVKTEGQTSGDQFFSSDSTQESDDDDQPRKITFQMKSRKDEDIILSMIDRLDGVRRVSPLNVY